MMADQFSRFSSDQLENILITQLGKEFGLIRLLGAIFRTVDRNPTGIVDPFLRTILADDR